MHEAVRPALCGGPAREGGRDAVVEGYITIATYEGGGQ